MNGLVVLHVAGVLLVCGRLRWLRQLLRGFAALDIARAYTKQI